MKPKSKAIILVESQPPHMGEFLQILGQLQKYDFLYICVTAYTSVMPIKAVFDIWSAALQPYAAKVRFMVSKLKFVDVMKDDMPQAFKDCHYLTANREIFVHLSSMNIDIELIPRALGYNSTFLRVAYRQSRALDWLENKFINSNTL